MMIAVNYSIVARCSRCILQAEASAACNSIVSSPNRTLIQLHYPQITVVMGGEGGVSPDDLRFHKICLDNPIARPISGCPGLIPTALRAVCQCYLKIQLNCRFHTFLPTKRGAGHPVPPHVPSPYLTSFWLFLM